MHGAKQHIHGIPIKFGYKLWVMATPLGYCIQFRPYAGKDTILGEYADIGLGLGASVVAHLVNELPKVPNSNYHVVMDNFFTSPELLRYLKENGIPAIGTVSAKPYGKSTITGYQRDGKRGSWINRRCN